jgi:diguanylate cyclase (GGDEF)-like protein
MPGTGERMSAKREGKRIAIIADDEEIGRLLLTATAAGAGLAPLAFDDGPAALEAALLNDVAIVLLDVDMPGMDGYSICRRLRAEGRFASVPIVMVTGHEDAAAIGLAFDAGATDFISKPVNWALLPRRLAYILRNAAAAERIERLAYFDTLTGLPNRQRCIDTAEKLFAEAKLLDERVAVIYLDLNNFKRVNDTFGHAVGDAVLQDVATRLSQTLVQFEGRFDRVVAARFGGDEFVILVRQARARSIAVEIAVACFRALKDPIGYDGLEFYSGPSIGAAIFPDDGADVASVFKNADTAMYQAKSAAADSLVMYTASMSRRQRDWLDLEGRLRRALQQGLLYLHYQPKFSLKDDQLMGVEALLRWHDPEYGNVEPARFIEIAEDSGLIIDVGNFVVRAACEQLRKWQDDGLALPIAINISGKEFLHGNPAKVVESEAARAGISASRLEVEITESLLVSDSPIVRNAMERLRRLGCRIALDDFGTGYSSLAYITRFPPDRIKIDKAFVDNLDRSKADAAIANAILSLGESLGIIVTAEGVERTAQLDWLRARACNEAQGFLLSPPLSIEELERRFLFPMSKRTRRPSTDRGPLLVRI